MHPYAETATIECSGLGFQATYLTASPISQILTHLPVSTSQIRKVPSNEPVRTTTDDEIYVQFQLPN